MSSSCSGNCKSCSSEGGCENKAAAERLKKIGKAVLVLSGKGGVGKSTVAAALAVQRAFDEEGVLENCREQGEFLRKALAEVARPYPFVRGVRGMGLMIGIRTVRPAKEIVNQCMERGVLALTAKDKVRLLPALNIPFEQLKEAVEVILAVCAGNSDGTEQRKDG